MTRQPIASKSIAKRGGSFAIIQAGASKLLVDHAGVDPEVAMMVNVFLPYALTFAGSVYRNIADGDHWLGRILP